MQPIRIGIAGLGTVGGGVVNLLHKQHDLIATRCGRPVEIVAAATRTLRRAQNLPMKNIRIVHDMLMLASEPDVDVVIEAVGESVDAAHALVTSALKARKPVITANKALMAHHGLELAKLAEKQNAPLLWEGAVAGAIPIVDTLRDGMSANRMLQLIGILNGTSNYILSNMSETGRDFAEVLKEAQENGFAPANPALDIDGTDSAHKLSLLAALAFGTTPNLKAVHVEGIRDIDQQDIEFASELGYAVKLLSLAQHTKQGLDMRVQPCLVPQRSPLGSVSDTQNAIIVEGDYADRVTLIGHGAGAMPTASAMVADLINLARGSCPDTFGLPLADLKPLPVLPSSDVMGCFYVRLLVKDQPGVIADVGAILRDHKISMEAFLQHGRNPKGKVPVVFTTHEASEEAIRASVKKIAKLSSVSKTPKVMRVLSDV